MTEEIMHFQMDIPYLLKLLIQMGFEKKYHGNKEYSQAIRFAYADVLVEGGDNGLTDKEALEIAQQYADDNNIPELRLTGEEPQQLALVETAIKKIPRIGNLIWEYTLKGYGAEYSVIDLIAKKEYKCDHGEHYGEILNIIRQDYKDEFILMNQSEKDDFILKNFKLIGQTMSDGWYTPTNITTLL